MLHPIRISSRGNIFNVYKHPMIKHGTVRRSLPYQGIARRTLYATNPMVDAALKKHFEIKLR